MDNGKFEGWLPLKGRSGRQQGLGKAQLRVAVTYVPVEQVHTLHPPSPRRAHRALGPSRLVPPHASHLLLLLRGPVCVLLAPLVHFSHQACERA